MSGYARGEIEYNAMPTTHESDEIEEFSEPEDYDECSDQQFTCKNTHCIDAHKRCDGTPHCDDGSDEVDCPGD
jgi:hypothetical protein